MGITSAQAQAQLTAWLAASTAVAAGQSYSMGDRMLTLANAKEILKMVDYWEGKAQTLSRGGFTLKGGTPCG